MDGGRSAVSARHAQRQHVRPRAFSLAAKPGANELVLAVTDNVGVDYAFVWNGSAWSTGQKFGGTAVATRAATWPTKPRPAAPCGLRGHKWLRGVLPNLEQVERFLAQARYGRPRRAVHAVARLCPSRVRPRSAIGLPWGSRRRARRESVPYWLDVWDGSAWGTPLRATTSGVDQLIAGIDVALESTSGEAVAAYGISGLNTVAYRTWTAGGGWSAERRAVAFTAAPRVVTLAADPYSDRVMLVEQDGSSDLYAA